MIYNRYGKIFKKIRNQSGFTLSDFSCVGLARTTLSDFELGKKMIGFDKIYIALEFMGISLAEYEDYLNYYSGNDTFSFIETLEHAILSKDKDILEDLLNKTSTLKYKYCAIVLKIILKKNTVEELLEVIDYLYGIKHWGHKELFIFYLLIEKLSPKDILNILSNLKKTSHGIYFSRKYGRDITMVLCRAITVLSYHQYKDQAKKIIDIIEQHNLPYTLFLRNLFLASKGYWVYIFINQNEGILMLKRFLDILHVSGEPLVAQYYQERFNKYIIEP